MLCKGGMNTQRKLLLSEIVQEEHQGHTHSKLPKILSYTSSEHIRLGHVLTCFFGGHHYRKLTVRDGYNEYICDNCGHPLMFSEENDIFSEKNQFTKKVRYQCNITKHLVQKVVERNGFSEYACFCGHTFLKDQPNLTEISHPAICAWIGHITEHVCDRSGISEYVCRNCGHTFYYGQRLIAKISKVFVFLKSVWDVLS